MKITNLKLTNFSKYDSVDVSFDPNVTYLVGKNGSGKSTLGITGIHFMFMGIAEKATDGKTPLIGERFRFIGPKGATAKGEMTLYDEKKGIEVRVMRKLTKTGTELSFIGPEGMELGQQWLNDLFNVFLIAPKRFCELSSKDQAKALGINTKPFDDAIATLKTEFTQINAVYRSYGELTEPEKAEKVDVEALQGEKATIREGMAITYRANQATNAAIRKAWEAKKATIDEEVKAFNKNQHEKEQAIQKLDDCLRRLRAIVAEVGMINQLVDLDPFANHIADMDKALPSKVASELYPAEPTNLSLESANYIHARDEFVYIKEVPDETELQAIDAKIGETSETNRKALIYEQWQESIKKKEAKKRELEGNTQRQKDKEAERTAYIKAFKFPFSNITVGDDGELLLAGKPIKEPYFSTGEILKVVPILLSTANPEMKYVFLQDFMLMDEEKQADVIKALTGKGLQLVIEMIGKEVITDKNCILLRDNIVVESYDTEKAPELI